MHICKNCGSEIVLVQRGFDIDTGKEIWLTNNSIYLCPSCLEVSEDLDDLTEEE